MNRKLRVHSSIDGLDTLKCSDNKTDKSIPLSDLILSDNEYVHLKVSPQNKNA